MSTKPKKRNILTALEESVKAREIGERMLQQAINGPGLPDEQSLPDEEKRILWQTEDFERTLRRYGYHSVEYCERYQNGWSIKELAKECGWSLRALAAATHID